MKKYLKFSVFALFLIGTLASCNRTTVDGLGVNYGIFRVVDSNTAVMNGVIKGRSVSDFEFMMEDHPNVEKIVMEDCPGSKDDDANLEMAREVFKEGIHFHLEDYSEIASGAVDLYLAGTKRTREPGSRIGVHSWADGNNNEASDYPKGHEEHQPYIDYFMSIGMSQQEAEDFYYFTVDAAPADDMHWMTEEEIDRFGLETE